MAKFIQIQDTVLDLEQISLIENEGNQIFVWINGIQKRVEFRNEQGKAVLRLLIEKLKPEIWNVPNEQ